MPDRNLKVTTDSINIAIVDDDELFRESVEQNLRDAGFDPVTFESGQSFLDHLDAGAPPALVLLDWKMPGMNGIEVLQSLRERSLDVPVIFLTVLSDQIFEEAALSGGAVDFVEKARSFSILRRRIDLIVSGTKGAGNGEDAADSAPVQIGKLRLEPESHLAQWNGKTIELTLNEFEIVRLLAVRGGRDVSYRELYDLVHGEGFVAGDGSDGYRTNVRTFIKRIRQKFRAIDEDFDEIRSYPGFGYRWGERGGTGT